MFDGGSVMRKKEMFKYGLGNPMNVIEEDFIEEEKRLKDKDDEVSWNK